MGYIVGGTDEELVPVDVGYGSRLGVPVAVEAFVGALLLPHHLVLLPVVEDALFAIRQAYKRLVGVGVFCRVGRVELRSQVAEREERGALQLVCIAAASLWDSGAAFFGIEIHQLFAPPGEPEALGYHVAYVGAAIVEVFKGEEFFLLGIHGHESEGRQEQHQPALNLRRCHDRIFCCFCRSHGCCAF